MRVTLRAKGQITLPFKVCEALGIGEGALLDVTYRAADDVIVIRPLTAIPRPEGQAER